MKFLLDTNACIALLNRSSDRLVARMRTRHPHDFAISSVVRAELTYGARHSRQVARNLDAIESFCTPFQSLAFDDDCAEEYGAIRAELEVLGQPIGPNDLMIAATAPTRSRSSPPTFASSGASSHCAPRTGRPEGTTQRPRASATISRQTGLRSRLRSIRSG